MPCPYLTRSNSPNADRFINDDDSEARAITNRLRYFNERLFRRPVENAEYSCGQLHTGYRNSVENDFGAATLSVTRDPLAAVRYYIQPLSAL